VRPASGLLEDDFDRAEIAEIRFDAIAGPDRIEARAGAGRDDCSP